MIAKNTTATELRAAMESVNADYGHNLRFKRGPEVYGRGFRFTLTVVNSAKGGARRSHQGRRIAAACWHAHRDYFRALYKLSPAALIKSAVATYDGAEDFERTFPGTGYRNIGSRAEPLSFHDACDC